jgi:hypothetical protein
LAGAESLTLAHMFDSFGNLTKLGVGSRGYEIFNAGGAGVNTTNLTAPIAVSVGSGWSNSNISGTNFTIDGVSQTQGAQAGAYWCLTTNSTATLNITPGDTNWHYVTLFCPSQFLQPVNYTISMTPTGLSSPAATYTTNQAISFSYLLGPGSPDNIYQFLFTGNVTVTVTGTLGTIGAIFFDDAPTPGS